ncbi:MAG: hypothetical protein Q7S10_03425 [bacterium]|nr:hypothetical protein [bacterium]
MSNLWSQQEIALLKENYPVKRVRDLAAMFPERTKATIAVKALSLGLPSAKLWQPEENKILREYFSKYPVQELLKLLPRRSKTAIWAQGERLGLKQNRNHPKLAVNEHYFKKWSPEMAYILGFILADGCIIEGTYKGYSEALKLGVNKKDIDILEKIKHQLSSAHKISLGKDAAHLGIVSQIIVNDLKKLRIGYRKSLKENIPSVPKKYVKDFIRGIVDGDGSIHFDKRNYPTLSICGGKNTITFLQSHFISEFNIYSKVGNVKKEGGQLLFYITYRANSAKTLIGYLYNNATLYLERKFKLAEKSSLIKIKHRKNYINYRKVSLNQ